MVPVARIVGLVDLSDWQWCWPGGSQIRVLSVRIRLGDIPEVAFRTRYGRGEFLVVYFRFGYCLRCVLGFGGLSVPGFVRQVCTPGRS